MDAGWLAAVQRMRKQPSLLAGLIFYEFGERLTPSHAVKKGTRYRYYVSRSLIVGTAKDKSTGRRIPAANLETIVITKLRRFLADEGAIRYWIREEHIDGAAQSRLIGRGVIIAKEIEFPYARPAPRNADDAA